MALTNYQKKRDFKKTPEPSGKVVRKKSGLPIFMIHKHRATRLHYDLRIECDGVLKSWAVPKGPSMNPSDKRMAILVEDHPYDYQDFEGIIPAGNYGAGEVIIWDKGNYSISNSLNSKEVQKEFNAGFEKGHISIVFNGVKIKGGFDLVRLSDKKNWLLIKKRDEFAREENNFDESSVKSHKTIEDLRGDSRVRGNDRKKDVEDLVNKFKITKTQMPKFIVPMLAELADEIFDDQNWLYEIKWDGYRAISVVDGNNIKLISRNGKEFKQYELINLELSKINRRCILDGEIVVLDDEGRAQFQLLQNSTGNDVVYYVFDILYLDDYNLMSLPLIERKKILQQILPVSPVIRYSDHVLRTGKSFYELLKGRQIEGVIAKNINSHYLPNKRSSQWKKIKILKRQEAIICGFTQPRESRKHFGALILGVYDDSKLIYVGHTGTGFDDKKLKILFDKMQSLVQKECPFEKKPITNMPATWLVPKLICEIQFSEWTEDGSMRHPVFLGLREDKIPEEIKKEIPKPIESKKIYPELNKEHKIITKEREVKITNPNKLYFPDDNYTKKDLINYYRNISKYILPHLLDRAESMHRQPDGINDNGFWHKDVKELPPDWVETFDIYSESEDKTNRYLVCNNEASLIYLVNLGCIEIHPWLSRTNLLDNPDFMILDLDPEDIEFKYVIKTALEIKKLMDALKIECFCKTSGSRGIHIYVPLGAKYNYEDSANLAKILAIVVHRKIPKFTSVERLPKNRKGRVYIDFLQNGKGKTMAAPYSVRPRIGAPVSTPLEWKELKINLDFKKFNIKTLPSRLEKKGDIWKNIYKKSINMNLVIKKLESLLI